VELACAFDLTSHSCALVTEPTLLKSLFPLKLLSEPLQFLLESLSSSVPAKPLVPLALAPRLIPIAPLAPEATLALVAERFASLDVSSVSPNGVPLFLDGIPNPPVLACLASKPGFGTHPE
jgi:hypothetical protein